MDTSFCFKTPRQACEGLDEFLKGKINLTKRPWDRFRPDSSSWWLVPSTDLPHFKHAKYFFKWGDAEQKSILCGYYIEKGLDELVSQVYTSKKARNLIMSQDWYWRTFAGKLKNGDFESIISQMPQEANLPVEIIIDGGYVTEPTAFDPYQERNLGWDVYNFTCDPASRTLVQKNIRRQAFVLKMHSVRNIKDLCTTVAGLSADEWLWLNFFIGMKIDINEAQITERDIAIHQAEQIWNSFLKHFADWVR